MGMPRLAGPERHEVPTPAVVDQQDPLPGLERPAHRPAPKTSAGMTSSDSSPTSAREGPEAPRASRPGSGPGRGRRRRNGPWWAARTVRTASTPPRPGRRTAAPPGRDTRGRTAPSYPARSPRAGSSPPCSGAGCCRRRADTPRRRSRSLAGTRTRPSRARRGGTGASPCARSLPRPATRGTGGRCSRSATAACSRAAWPPRRRGCGRSPRRRSRARAPPG